MKVSRNDLRSELLKPWKRKPAMEVCDRFFFAIPRGLLSDEEISYSEPVWTAEDFARTPCPGIPAGGGLPRYARRQRRPVSRFEAQHCYGGICCKAEKDWMTGKRAARGTHVKVPIPCVLTLEPDPYPLDSGAAAEARLWSQVGRAVEKQGEAWVVCPRCGGKGYLRKSRVEREAPQCWIPSDVGLVVVDGRGCEVVRNAPKLTPRDLSMYEMAGLMRWASVRPDPRHRGLRAVKAPIQHEAA